MEQCLKDKLKDSITKNEAESLQRLGEVDKVLL